MLAIRVVILLSATFLFFSCDSDRFGGRAPLAEVGGQLLYKEDLKNIFFAEMSKEDSLAAVENYVRSWATDILMYEKAQQNIKNEEEISLLLEKYRRSLLIYEYQLQLVKDRLSNSISPEDVKSYYLRNPHLFKLKEVLIKGIFLKIPNKAPDVDALRSLMLRPKESDLDKIESLSIKNAAKFEYFNEKWHPLLDVQRKSPIRVEPPFRQYSFHESRDSLSTYFLFIQEYKPEGELQPFEYAESRIRGILLEQKKSNFLKQFSNRLYEDGLNKGKIKIYQ